MNAPTHCIFCRSHKLRMYRLPDSKSRHVFCDECGAAGPWGECDNEARSLYTMANVGLVNKVGDGVFAIADERIRQITVKGYTPQHDDEHDLGELGLAAALYALPYDAKQGNDPLITQDDFINLHIALETGCGFYVDPEPDKLKRLAKAGALIAAEFDRVKRAANNAIDSSGDCDSCGKSVPESEIKGAMTSAGVEGLFCHECRHGKNCDCPPSSDPGTIVECDVCDNTETLGGEISERTLEDAGWYLGDISILCPDHAAAGFNRFE